MFLLQSQVDAFPLQLPDVLLPSPVQMRTVEPPAGANPELHM